MKKTIALLLTFWIFSSSLSQETEAFNKIYTQTFVETSHTDFEKSLAIADSLFQISETPFFQTKSLMLSASLFTQAGDLKEAIEYAEKALKIIEKTTFYDWQARVHGFLATQHRNMLIYSQSEFHVNQAIEAAKKISDPQVAGITLNLLLQEKAFLAKDKENYNEALELFTTAGEYFKQMGDSYLIAQNEMFKGACALGLQEFDQALMYYQTALEFFGDLPDNYVKGLIYTGLAEVHLQQKNLNRAKENLIKAGEIAKHSSYLEFLNKYYSTAFKYHGLVGDVEQLNFYSHRRDSIQALLTTQKSKYLDQSYANLNTANTEFSDQLQQRGWVILGSIVLFLGGLLYFMHYRKKQKRQVRKIQSIVAELEQQKALWAKQAAEQEAVLEEVLEEKEEVEQETAMMSPEIEARILRQLLKFEQSTLFTKNSISLSVLAAYCKTNTKYLSHCINHHKGMDFYNYINDLRIKYIIDKLLNEPVYRKYKFATLAEEAGFSSANKFSTIFKKSTTLSPSVFIKQLDK
ncbi:MAG TPA: helix-turn-helix domain-containing protein [Moheibacter sp.]|nr:helix-turn-helix domain-containing protein [Moheibacter sp.]